MRLYQPLAVVLSVLAAAEYAGAQRPDSMLQERGRVVNSRSSKSSKPAVSSKPTSKAILPSSSPVGRSSGTSTIATTQHGSSSKSIIVSSSSTKASSPATTLTSLSKSSSTASLATASTSLTKVSSQTTSAASLTSLSQTSATSSTASPSASVCTKCKNCFLDPFVKPSGSSKPSKSKQAPRPSKTPSPPVGRGPVNARTFSQNPASSLQKRFQRTTNLCGNNYNIEDIIPYPPAAGEVTHLGDIRQQCLMNPNLNMADCINGIHKYFHFKTLPSTTPFYAEGGFTGQLCAWELQQSPLNQIETNPNHQIDHFQTEHVLEIHFFKTFLHWLRNTPGLGITCQQIDNIMRDTVTGQATQTMRNILQEWSRYDIPNGGLPAGRETEFFIILKELNGMKHRIFNSDEDINKCLVGTPREDRTHGDGANDMMNNAHARLRDISLVFEYMKEPQVVNAFNAANARIRAAWDTEMRAYFGANAANAANDFAQPNPFNFAAGGLGFQQAWDHWLVEFLNAKVAAVRTKRDAILDEMVRGASAIQMGTEARNFAAKQKAHAQNAAHRSMRKLSKEALSLPTGPGQYPAGDPA